MNLILIFAGLLFKHFLCDFPLQTHYQFGNKGTYGHKGGVLHASIHAAGTLCVLLFVTSIEQALMLAALEGFMHYHIDWAKNKLNKRLNLTPASGSYFWVLFGFDQFLHQMTYVLILWLLVR